MAPIGEVPDQCPQRELSEDAMKKLYATGDLVGRQPASVETAVPNSVSVSVSASADDDVPAWQLTPVQKPSDKEVATDLFCG